MRFAILLLIPLFLSDLIGKTESYDHCSCSLEKKKEAAEIAMFCSCPKKGGILESHFQQRKDCSVTTKKKEGKMDEFEMKMKCPRPDCTLVVSNENFTVSPGGGSNLNDVVTVTCNDGYVLSDLGDTQQNIRCTETGFNMKAIIPCYKDKPCVLDELLMNRMFSISPAPHYILNDVVTITCIDGHALSSLGDTQQNISCTENGFNMDDIIPCTILCTLEQSLLNEKMAVSPVHNYLMNEVATITCNDDLFWIDTETEQNITCTENGFDMDDIIPCLPFKQRCTDSKGIYNVKRGYNAIFVTDKKNKEEASLDCDSRNGFFKYEGSIIEPEFKEKFASILGTQGPIWYQIGAIVFDPATDAYSPIKTTKDTILPYFCDCPNMNYKK